MTPNIVPRKPTSREMREMIECHHSMHRNDNIEFFEWLAEQACITVFDRYQQLYGKSYDKLMVVVWPTRLEHYQLFAWVKGRISFVPFEWTVADHEKNVMMANWLLERD